MNKLTKTVRKRKLTGSIATLITVACMSMASAHEVDSKYTMAAISDAAYGAKVLSGDYEAAIRKIRISGDTSVRNFFSANNLCVAYVQLRDITNASEACETAVAGIQAMLAHKRKYASGYEAYRRYLAIALSNRGVLRAISGNEELAHEDFSDAIQLDVRLTAPATNMARLNKGALPQA